MSGKNLQLERLVFFSDAVIAIAITLLALELRVEATHNGHLQFRDLLSQWHVGVAFGLSFFNIANFWLTHHRFFAYIRRIDERLLWCNIWWLLFIVLLPFTTSLVSNYFGDVPAIVCYSLDMLLIAIFQNTIWDYACDHGLIDTEAVHPLVISRFRLFCNLDMLNGLICTVVAFFHPKLAFIFLLTKLPVILVTGIYYRRQIGARRGMQRGSRKPGDEADAGSRLQD